MHERKKLNEAKYFFDKMVEEQVNFGNFTYNLSAFLSSARSVLQYALDEAETKTRGKKWYDKCISDSALLRFFRDLRDINIHTEPIRPQKHHNLTLTTSLSISESTLITLTNKNGKIKQQSSSDAPEPKPKEPETSVDLEIMYKFDDWYGNEDILTLCQRYIQELDNLIIKGVRQGFITG